MSVELKSLKLWAGFAVWLVVVGLVMSKLSELGSEIFFLAAVLVPWSLNGFLQKPKAKDRYEVLYCSIGLFIFATLLAFARHFFHWSSEE